ncbi:MAG: hypothetical protein KAV87_23545 [Desulfobacteraceae bacterium]|nr:hypothetical protein [Desulfobacteraceae bacterium]
MAISGSNSNPGDWTGNINVFLGMKYLDEGDWAPIEDKLESGITVDFKQQGWPVSIAIGYLLSSDDSFGLYYFPGIGTITNVQGETTELSIGVRKIWDHSPVVRPFIGGGIALISAELEAWPFANTVSDHDDAIGIWIGGGVYWTLAGHFNLGFNLRWSKAEVTLFGVDSEAGGIHAGFFLGFHW